MSALQTALAGVARACERFNLHSVEIYGVSYSCTAGTRQEDSFYDSGGKRIVCETTVHIRKELLPSQLTADLAALTVDSDTTTVDDSSAPPRPGVRCKLDAREYRIGRVTDLGSVFALKLEDPDK